MSHIHPDKEKSVVAVLTALRVVTNFCNTSEQRTSRLEAIHDAIPCSVSYAGSNVRRVDETMI